MPPPSDLNVNPKVYTGVLRALGRRHRRKTAWRGSAENYGCPSGKPVGRSAKPSSIQAYLDRPEALYDYYELFNHEDQIDNGHYTSFARFQDTVHAKIYLPFDDDDRATPATLAEVLGTTAQIYLAFYVKRRLDYKPHTTPYVLTWESELRLMREREALGAQQEQAQAQMRESEDELLMTEMTIAAGPT
ncbi:hypothetical protein BJY52DRAFT_1374230 [Lactarius psammicola]|nr:hypothetical protein BJY52DRAFT_1374230 [Lactarius psammicola]